MSLIEITPGSEAKSQTLNDNFDYLEELVVNYSQTFESRISSANNNIANIATVLKTVQNELSATETSINSIETELEGKASKDLSDVKTSSVFKSNVLDYVSPNYGAGYSISSGWTSPKAGWIYLGGKQDNTSTVVVGGKTFEVSYDSGDGQSRGNLFMFIGKGVAVTSFSDIREARFYPCKGN